MLIDNLKKYLRNENEEKIVFILPHKYHNLLLTTILKEQPFLSNIVFLSIDNFYQQVLKDNNLVVDENDSLLAKLTIHQNLQATNHQYACKINFINELYQLEQEFIHSNLEYQKEMLKYDDYGQYLKTSQQTFTNLNINYDKIIILSNEDFYPVHHQLLSSLASQSTIIEIEKNINTNYHYYEIDNNIKMVDSFIYEVVNKQHQGLVICDDDILRSYLNNKLNNIGISTNLIKPNLNNKQINFNKLYHEFSEEYQSLPYQALLEKLYHTLAYHDFFKLNYLNKLFSNLYHLNNIDSSLLLKLLIHPLTNQLQDHSSYQDASLIIAGNDFLALSFNNVWIIDGSMKKLVAKKASFLLSTEERLSISPDLINNQYYDNLLHHKQEHYLSQLTNNLHIYYSMLSFDNKSQKLAHFLATKQNHDNTIINPVFKHYLNQNAIITYQETSGQLDHKLLIKSINNELIISTSSLDNFGECPYKYFINNIIKPQEPDQFDYRIIGTTMHTIIENINNSLINNKTTTDDMIQKILNDNINPLFDKYHLTSAEHTILRKDIITIFNKYLFNYQQYSSLLKDLTDYSLTKDMQEYRLLTKYTHESSLKVSIKGIIDCVMNNKKDYLVIDYKTGHKAFHTNWTNCGIDNQLALYLYLMKKNNYNIDTSLYCSLKPEYLSINSADFDFNNIEIDKVSFTGLSDNEMIKNSKKITNQATTILINKETNNYFIEEHFNKLINAYNTASFPIYPNKQTSYNVCQYCNLNYICRYHENYVYIGGEDDE
ncbi:MAG: PD-(D/E)XK nuclease family protein [Bacilli bacterium]|jgi:CRISPR/Cas system-associated exonuclease Cas4 (RecB family)|nr:PD-(D/E)XK nuclease family protein [Bacilli bacterium]